MRDEKDLINQNVVVILLLLFMTSYYLLDFQAIVKPYNFFDIFQLSITITVPILFVFFLFKVMSSKGKKVEPKSSGKKISSVNSLFGIWSFIFFLKFVLIETQSLLIKVISSVVFAGIVMILIIDNHRRKKLLNGEEVNVSTPPSS